MAVVLWIIAGLVAVQLLFALWNLSSLPNLGGTGEGRRRLADGNDPGNSAPLFSVLIPARDEAANIGDCLKSVLAEPSTLIEVTVLDDGSRDGTAAVARRAALDDRRASIIAGIPKPDGWTGKAFACHQLAQAARGEWWLFLDADARLEHGALAAAMDTALIQRQGLVTGFPRQVTRTWLERLVVPLMNFTIACHLPIRFVRGSDDPKFVAAHGAFMLVHADSYREAGGHAANPNHLVDDMQLARAFKKAKLPVSLVDISAYVYMRMYADGASVWSGYRKNIYAGTGRNGWLLTAIMLFYGALYVLPPAALAASVLTRQVDWMTGASAGTLLGVALKYVVDRRGRQPLPHALLLPPGIAALIGIALASWRDAARGVGYEWKGRRYE
ncbi:glycosyltransferase [Paenibacillus methanolicus]|uniref:4,4'-diaponeurosporenoate glycosyltransferase n=1 Tax=Paenibacillus methanolicus TaxID=582686 RepID=A0A5S5CI91_9BACL|nr:glycosyltransferase family 2 protein [Paenibacillus methanolicus]TYP79506.1 glycosyl transferase family 2 [Paenibacillus methanolicus]